MDSVLLHTGDEGEIVPQKLQKLKLWSLREQVPRCGNCRTNSISAYVYDCVRESPPFLAKMGSSIPDSSGISNDTLWFLGVTSQFRESLLFYKSIQGTETVSMLSKDYISG